MFCTFCGKRCGVWAFCDETCYDEYRCAVAERQASYEEDYPGESLVDTFDEPPEFDVVGGL